MITPAWLSLILLVGSVSPQQTTYVHDGSGWLRTEGAHTFRVDPRIVTVRASLELDVQGTLSSLGAPLAEARVVRENRLGFRDVRVPEDMDVMGFVTLLRESGKFEHVEENTQGVFTGGTCASSIMPTFADQWNLENTGQTGGADDADIDALLAWGYEDGDPSVVVAIIDSGTNWNHEDLVGNIWGNDDEVLDGTDTDLNGFVDDIRGWDFEDDDNSPDGLFWHGTATASIVAARGQNSLGIEGVAGGANDGVGSRVMIVKVGEFFPEASVVDDAVLYAIDNGADVINLSLGMGSSAAMDAALDLAEANDVFVVASAGDDLASPVNYPSSYPSVVCVTSTLHFDIVSNLSNIGPEVDVGAPGELVPACNLGDTDYILACGSSFAVPHVAALAALLRGIKPELGNAAVLGYITEWADDIELPGEDVFSGAGRINANSSLRELATGYAKVYGVGTHGTGTVPGMMVSAVPRIGETLEVTTDNALPGAFAALGFSPQEALIPFLGGFLNIHPTGMLLFSTVIDSNGDASRFFPIPNETYYIAGERYLQWFVVDAGAPGGLAMSRGMNLRVAAP